MFEPVDRPLELADPSIAFGDLELPASALLCQLLVSGVSGARSFLAKDVRDEVTEDPFVRSRISRASRSAASLGTGAIGAPVASSGGTRWSTDSTRAPARIGA